MSVDETASPCWFCRHSAPADDLVFDAEFDTPVHLSCILTALEKDPNDPEARIMSYLLDPGTPQQADEEGEPDDVRVP